MNFTVHEIVREVLALSHQVDGVSITVSPSSNSRSGGRVKTSKIEKLNGEIGHLYKDDELDDDGYDSAYECYVDEEIESSDTAVLRARCRGNC